MQVVAKMLAFVALLSGCAHQGDSITDPRIDGTSPESFRASWQHVNSRLSSREQQQLMFAVLKIALAPYDSVTEVPDEIMSNPIRSELIREEVDGMTYDEVVALAEESTIEVEIVPSN